MDIEEMLDRLGVVIGPPPADGVTPLPWELAPAAIGFELPTDYRAFADRYGSVSISNELHIFTPTEVPRLHALSPSG